MDEQEWNACTEPQKMLESLRSKASDRKLRLFACACARRIWDLLTDRRSSQAVEVAEGYADGRAGWDELQQAQREAQAAAWDEEWAYVNGENWIAARGFAGAAAGVSAESAVVAVYAPDAHEAAEAAALAAYRAWTQQGAAYATLLRCVFGNPFCPVSLAPAWLTADVASLAQAAYENRALSAGTLEPARLALVADALEDAGCTAADILGHLRSGGPHVRGCWALDLVLGLE